MTTREKIIVAMMCATIAYGAYEVLSSSATKDSPKAAQADPTAEMQRLVTDISTQLVGRQGKDNKQYPVELAAGAWSKDPFIRSTQPLQDTLAKPDDQQEAASSEPPQPQWRYSGFLAVGQEKLAIIDGLEYAEGDALGSTSYYVKGIASSYVVVGKINGSETIRLPLQEGGN